MPTIFDDFEHPTRTQVGSLRYLFTKKHHGADKNASQWLPSLSFAEEFAVFDSAVLHEISDNRGRMFGVESRAGVVLKLGTHEQQIAMYPVARSTEAWHGWPIFPVDGLEQGNRSGENTRPPKEVFRKMELAGLLTRKQSARLSKGDHA